MSVTQKSWLTELFPFLVWARSYSGNDFQADLIAGVVVVFITIPQVIAYAYLAGLPAEYGLYAAIMSLAGYAAFGSCRTLAVGPAAILAMMTLEAISDQAQPGSAAYVALATKLTLVTGGLLIILRIINFGAVISFLSHSVVTGFIAASAILIIANQIPSILGISQSPGTAVDVVVPHIFTHLDSINLVVLGIAAGAMLLLWFCRHQLEGILLRTGLSARLVTNLVKSAPMYAVILSVLCVWWLSLADTRSVAVVGPIPDAWPALGMMTLTLTELQRLLPSALLIAMVIFMESTSIGSAVASKSRQKIEPNQELVGL
ncbi:MAG: sodium-independent anion transporter, partial [Pseudomonadales bacterium]|nr:sodium-independent anion transporter [Pseudomonadales bacterium]